MCSVEKKQDVFRRIKIGGSISFIPFILVSGPLGGYLIGTYLKEKFRFDGRVVTASVVIGLIASLAETVRVIIRVKKMSEES